MSTHVTTQNLVRSDVAEASADRPATRRTSSRGWAYAGIGAGLAGIGTIVTSSMVNAIYDKDIAGDPAAIMAKLEDQTGAMFAFHTFTTVGAVLLLVFAAESSAYTERETFIFTCVAMSARKALDALDGTAAVAASPVLG